MVRSRITPSVTLKFTADSIQQAGNRPQMPINTESLHSDHPEDIVRAAALLTQGKLVAIPTETVYGLAANGLSADAVKGIFSAKGRPADNPLILHVASIEAAIPLWAATTKQLEIAAALSAAFWPGPLSIVLKAASAIPDIVTAGLDSVAIRAPAGETVQSVMQLCQFPLAAPSANVSGRPSPTRADHVERTLGGRIAAILDDGQTTIGIESTVVDLRSECPQLLRPGAISIDDLRSVIGEVSDSRPSGNAASPGLRHRHYQPVNISLRLANREMIESQWASAAGIACSQDLAVELGQRRAPIWIMPDTPEPYAAVLYDRLYTMERSGVTEVYLQRPPQTDAWRAVNDRLTRAAEATPQ